MSLAEGARLGPYEILGLLGAGGMGEVYRARDPRLGRHVAIKILPAAFSSDDQRAWRFEREARAIASLNHPHICTIHDIGEHEGHRYLVMELMEGTPLDQRLATGALPLSQVLDLGVQIADALDAAHTAGIVHRDLKPANIFVTKRGEAKLLDFGLAKLETADAPSTTTGAGLDESPTVMSPGGKTTFGSLLGTAAYMSPEQARGEPADAQSDLFSFGVVLYEMSTGRPAFSGRTAPLLFDAILNKDPLPLHDVNPALPDELVRIVEKALEKDRDLRYRSAADVRADLKRLARESASPRRSRQTTGGDAAAGGLATAEPFATATLGKTSSPLAQPSSLSAAGVPDESGQPRAAGRSGKRLRLVAIVLTLLVISQVRRLMRSDREHEGGRRSASTLSLDALQVSPLSATGNAFRPSLSRDGQYIVYLQGDESGWSVLLRQSDTTNSVKIYSAEANTPLGAATIGPDNSFVDVWSRNAIWRVPFLGGAPKLIIDRVLTPIGWSPDGKAMAYIRPNPSGDGADLVVANADGGSPRVVATKNSPGFATAIPGVTAVAPAWSPDGKRVGFFQRLSEDIRDMGVALFDVDDGEEAVVRIRGDVPLGLGWRDQRSLLIVQASESGTPSQVWQVAVTSGERTRVTNDTSRYSELSLTADANVMVTSRPETRVDVWIGDDNGEGRDFVRPAPFLSSASQYAVVGWDRDRLLFTHTLNGRYEIFRTATDGPPMPEAIVHGREFSVAGDGAIVYRSVGDEAGLWKVGSDGRPPVELAKGTVSFPLVTPDGQQVVFSAAPQGRQTVWRVPITGGEPTQIEPEGMGLFSYSDVSPDGRSIIMIFDRQWTLCSATDCSNRRAIGPVLGTRPRWRPNGREFTYVDAAGVNIATQAIDGGPSRPVTHFTDGRSIASYAWSRDGKRLAVSRVRYSSDIVLFSGLNGTAAK